MQKLEPLHSFVIVIYSEYFSSPDFTVLVRSIFLLIYPFSSAQESNGSHLPGPQMLTASDEPVHSDEGIRAQTASCPEYVSSSRAQANRFVEHEQETIIIEVKSSQSACAEAQRLHSVCMRVNARRHEDIPSSVQSDEHAE